MQGWSGRCFPMSIDQYVHTPSKHWVKRSGCFWLNHRILIRWSWGSAWDERGWGPGYQWSALGQDCHFHLFTSVHWPSRPTLQECWRIFASLCVWTISRNISEKIDLPGEGMWARLKLTRYWGTCLTSVLLFCRPTAILHLHFIWSGCLSLAGNPIYKELCWSNFKAPLWNHLLAEARTCAHCLQAPLCSPPLLSSYGLARLAGSFKVGWWSCLLDWYRAQQGKIDGGCQRGKKTSRTYQSIF